MWEVGSAAVTSIHTPDSAIVAGHVLDEASSRVARYLSCHAQTVKHCDMRAGSWATLSQDAVASSRRPFLNSRISREQGNQLVARAKTADWSLLSVHQPLASKDQREDDATMARALGLYAHFLDPKIPGVSRGKVHKILYIMRPAYFPIVDSRLARLYRKPALEWNSEFRRAGGQSDYFAPAYWAAIRADIRRNTDVIKHMRTKLSSVNSGEHTEVIARLTDVRILDMLAWSMESAGC
jgi:hypothetical protein